MFATSFGISEPTIIKPCKCVFQQLTAIFTQLFITLLAPTVYPNHQLNRSLLPLDTHSNLMLNFINNNLLTINVVRIPKARHTECHACMYFTFYA